MKSRDVPDAVNGDHVAQTFRESRPPAYRGEPHENAKSRRGAHCQRFSDWCRTARSGCGFNRSMQHTGGVLIVHFLLDAIGNALSSSGHSPETRAGVSRESCPRRCRPYVRSGAGRYDRPSCLPKGTCCAMTDPERLPAAAFRQRPAFRADSPEGYPVTPTCKYRNWHDSYVADAPPDKKWVEVSDAGGAASRNQRTDRNP